MKLTIKQMQEMVSNSNGATQINMLKNFAAYQDFSDPNHVNLLFRSHPLLILENQTISIENLLLNDDDNFWKQVFRNNEIIRHRYINENLLENYPNLFLIDEAIRYQSLSENFISKLLSNDFSIQILLVTFQNLTRNQRNNINKGRQFDDLMVKHQTLDDDEIIFICYPAIMQNPNHQLLSLMIEKQKISIKVLFQFGAKLALVSDFFYRQQYSEEDLITIIKFVREGSNFYGRPYHSYEYDVNWSAISESQHLTEDFIFRYRNFVDWKNISRNQKLSANFLQRFSRHISFELYFEHNKFITEDIIKIFFKRSYFEVIQENSHVDFFLIKNTLLEDDIDSFKNINSNSYTKPSATLRDTCKKLLTSKHFWALDNTESDSIFDVETLQSDLGFSLNDMLFFDNMIGLCKKLKDFYPINDGEFWPFVWQWCSCSEDFIEFALKTYPDIIVDWETISKYQKLSFQFINTYFQRLDIKTLIINQTFLPNELDNINNILDICDSMSQEEFKTFLNTQHCSQYLLKQLINKMPWKYTIILQTQKLNWENLKEIISNEPTLKKIAYQFQQPFSFEELNDVMETLKFEPKAINIFPKGMGIAMFAAGFVPKKYLTVFKILNNIRLTSLLLPSIPPFGDNSDMFHQFLTDEMFESFPKLFFGDSPAAKLNWTTNHSIDFIKKWILYLSPPHILEDQYLDEELIEHFFNLSRSGITWLYFFENRKISNEIKKKYAIKYNKCLPVRLR